jgi:1-deoxyxylulose-5-phosphate synthase
MSFGNAAAGLHRWTLDEAAAAPFFQQAVELGVTFWVAPRRGSSDGA